MVHQPDNALMTIDVGFDFRYTLDPKSQNRWRSRAILTQFLSQGGQGFQHIMRWFCALFYFLTQGISIKN